MKWFRKYPYSFGLHPDKHSIKHRVYKGKFWSAISDIDVILSEDNPSEWCRENCKGKFKFDFENINRHGRDTTHNKKVIQLLRDYGFERQANHFQMHWRGIFTVHFTNTTDAAMFRLTFSDINPRVG